MVVTQKCFGRIKAGTLVMQDFKFFCWPRPDICPLPEDTQFVFELHSGPKGVLASAPGAGLIPYGNGSLHLISNKKQLSSPENESLSRISIGSL